MGEMEEKLNAILGDPSAMGQIMALAQSLGGKNGGGAAPIQAAPQPDPYDTPPPPPSPPQPVAPEDGSPLGLLGDIDPRMIQMGMQLLQEYQGEDDRTMALLSALRPFVKEERFAKLDRAMQVSRLSRVIRVLFKNLGKGGGGNV